MEFKTNPNVICDVCGSPVYYCGVIMFDNSEVIYFKCSNEKCDYSDNPYPYGLDELPEWVVSLTDLEFDDANLTEME